MADEQLESLRADLKRWGNAKVAHLAANEDGPSAGDSVLARQRDLGLRSRLKREKEREIVGRCGEDRRRYMARKASSEKLKLTILPMWSVDPIPARNDASRPGEGTRAVVDLVPDELRWIDRAVAQMARNNQLRAMCLREEFCGVGTQKTKASQVARLYGGTLSVWMYRREIQMALEWLNAKRAA